MLAAEASALQTAFTTALGTVQTDVIGYVTAALPVALAIMGTFIAVKLGIKFFKSAAK